MGMPISLALRGRHADDRPGAAAWAAAMAALREVDQVFSTYRADSVVSRLGRGEVGLADCRPRSPRCWPSPSAPERESGGAFRVRRPGPDGDRGSTPAASSRAGRWSARPRPLARARRTPTSASPPAATWSAGPSTRRRAWRIGIEDPHDPTPDPRRRPGAQRCGRHLRDRPPRRPHGRRPHRAAADGVASVTVVAGT